jgi:peptidoglycan lytic transglycosylase
VLLSRTESCHDEDTGALSLLELTPASIDLLPVPSAPGTGHDMLDTVGIALASVSTSGVDLISYAKRKMLPQFTTVYRAVLQRVAMMGLPRIQDEAALTHSTIVGTVSTYNPYRDGNEEGGPQTASGEPYDPAAWTAAIKTDLRNQFGGIRYGKLYQPAFALVESGDKQLIVKINDVGPLKPRRVLDLNERSMRHFDPYLTRGLIKDVKITLLPGEDWTPGPVDAAYAIDFSGSEWRAASTSGPAEDFRLVELPLNNDAGQAHPKRRNETAPRLRHYAAFD